MKVKVICDERTKEDKYLGVNTRAGWNERPYYLLNKILQSPKFQPDYLTLDDLALDPVNEGISILHLDQTIHPREITDLIQSYVSGEIKILNRNVTDISKRRMDELFASMGGTKLCIQRGECYDGPVMVKSNYNAGDARGRVYSVLRRDKVDEALWEDPDVVVQRFVSSTNRRNALKKMDRYVMFMGEVAYCSFLRAISLKEILVYGNIIEVLRD